MLQLLTTSCQIGETCHNWRPFLDSVFPRKPSNQLENPRVFQRRTDGICCWLAKKRSQRFFGSEDKRLGFWFSFIWTLVSESLRLSSHHFPPSPTISACIGGSSSAQQMKLPQITQQAKPPKVWMGRIFQPNLHDLLGHLRVSVPSPDHLFTDPLEHLTHLLRVGLGRPNLRRWWLWAHVPYTNGIHVWFIWFISVYI